MPKLSLLNFGEKGVVIGLDPLHNEPGDLLLAQNVSFFTDGQRGGLGKRDGIGRYTVSTCAGRIYSIYSVTFEDPTPGAILTDDALVGLLDEAFYTLTE